MIEQRSCVNPGRSWRGRSWRSWTTRLAIAMVTASLMSLSMAARSGEVAALVTYREHAGVLPDGTRYMMRSPSNWNGTLIRDLDYASAPNSHRNL